MRIIPTLSGLIPAPLRLGSRRESSANNSECIAATSPPIALDALEAQQMRSRPPSYREAAKAPFGWDRLTPRQKKLSIGVFAGAVVLGVSVGLVVPITLTLTRHKAGEPTLQNLPPAPDPTWMLPTNQSFVGGVNGSFFSEINGRANAKAACNFTADAVSARSGMLRLSVLAGDYGLHNQGCGELDTNSTFLLGKFSVSLKAAKQNGVVTQAFTYVEVLPNYNSEIDIKILGNDTRAMQAIAWRDGTPTAMHVPLAFDASQAFHEYAFTWTNDSVAWFVDDERVASLSNTTLLPRSWSAPFVVNTWLSPSGAEAGIYDNATAVSAATDIAWLAYEPLGLRLA